MRAEFPNPIRKIFKDMSVVLVVPTFGGEGRFIQSMVNATCHSWLHGLRVYEMGLAEKQVIHWGRNNLGMAIRDAVCRYTKQKYTHAIWLDSDQVFGPDLFVELAKNFYKPEVDVVSAVYYSRTGRPTPNLFVKDDNKSKYEHYSLIQFPPGLFEIDGFGFGACMMKRDVLDRVPFPWFRFEGCGEDVYFCVKAKENGVRLWVDGALKIGHIGEPPVIGEKDFLKDFETNKDFYKDKAKVCLNPR